MDPIVLSNKHYRVFESLFNVEGEVHMNITFAEYIKAMEAAGFLFQWLKKGRFDPPAGLAGGPLFVFKLKHDKLSDNIMPFRQNEIRRALAEKYGLRLASFMLRELD